MKKRVEQGVTKIMALFVLICIAFNCGIADVMSYLTEGLTVYAVEPTIVSSGNCGANGNNVKYTLDSDGTLIISGNGKMKDYDNYLMDELCSPFYAIKEKIRVIIIEANVTSIGEYTFSFCECNNIQIPNTVTNIGISAFSDCDKLSSVIIPNSVTQIGMYAFSKCHSLESVTISNSLLVLPHSIFEDCESLDNVVIPQNVNTIENYAFYNCTNLKSVTLSNNLKRIGDFAFGSSGLLKVTLPSGVTAIGDRVFHDCVNLTDIYIDNNTSYSSVDGVLFDKNQKKLIKYPPNKKIEYYTVPSNVTTIDADAFGKNKYLKKIILPDDLLYIGMGAFLECEELVDVLIPDSISELNNSLFASCNQLKNVYLPRSIKTIRSYVFENCENLSDIYFAGTGEEWNNIEYIYFKSAQDGDIHLKMADVPSDSIFKKINVHFGVNKENFVDGYHFFHYPKIIEPGMTFQIGADKLGGNFTGKSLTGAKKAEWVVSNPDRIKIIASKDNHTQAVMQALSIGDCDVTFKINDVPVCTETIHITISGDTLVKRYKDCILNAPTLTSIKNGLRTSTDVLSELSFGDIQTATAFTMLSQNYLGIDMAIDNTAKYIKTGQYFSDSDDTILNQIIATYLALPQDDDYVAEFTKKYQLVYNTIQAGKSIKGVKDNLFQQLSDATSFDSNSIKELFSSAGDLDVFDKFGYVADTYISYTEISATVLLIAQFDLDTIRHLKSVVRNADNGSNSSLYKALERLEKNIKNLDMYSNTEYLKATLKSILNITADALLDKLLPGSSLVIDIANFLASIYENDGGIMLDDVTNLTVSLHFANIIYQSLINISDGQELQYAFDFLKATTLVSLQCDVPIIEGKSKLKNYKKKVKIISDEIIKNCSFSKLLLEATESAQDKKATLSNSDMLEQFGVISQYGITTAVDQGTSKSTSSGVSGTSSTSKSSDYLSIPSNKNGYSITEIAKEGYKGYNGTTIAIPDTVKKIGQEAFSDSKNVQTVLLGSGLQTIEQKAFYNCVALEYISIPKSVQTIAKSAFENCSKLDVITINAKSIGDKAFSGCKNLSRVYISNRQATIGKDVFKDCQKDLTIVGYSGSTSETYAKANSINFEAIKEYISNISISKSSTKKNYMLGEEVDTTGMELTVEYKDGAKKTVNSGWLISYDTTSYGIVDTHVIYGDSQTSYQIAVDSEPDIDLSFDTSKIEMLFGTEYSIAEQLKMNLPYDSVVTWSSDSPEIVSVDCFGLLKSLTPGKAIISAKTPYSNKIAECEVTVTDSIMIEPDSSPKFIMLEPDNDNQFVFSANTTTGDTSLYILDDQNQVINGTESIKTPFSCYLQNKPYVVKISTDEAIKISISGYSVPKYLSLINESGQTITEVSGYSGDDISVSVNSDESDMEYYWESSNLSVADVDKGKIHLNYSGIATITVRNSRNEIAKCKVVVLEKKPKLSVLSDSTDVSSSGNSSNAETSITNESPQSESNLIVYILLFVFLAVVIIVIIAIVVIRKKQKRKHTTI